MSFKNLIQAGKDLVSETTNTIKQSGIVDKATNIAKEAISKVESLAMENYTKYTNASFQDSDKIFLTNDEVTEILVKFSGELNQKTLESFKDALSRKQIKSVKFFYSNGEEIKVGDVVYIQKYKMFLKFEKVTEYNVEEYLETFGSGHIIKSEKSISEIEKYIR